MAASAASRLARNFPLPKPESAPEKMCQFLCQFDSDFGEQWRTTADTKGKLNRSLSTKARLSPVFRGVTKRIMSRIDRNYPLFR